MAISIGIWGAVAVPLAAYFSYRNWHESRGDSAAWATVFLVALLWPVVMPISLWLKKCKV